MRTFRTIGVIGTAAALLLSAGVAFAQGDAGGENRGVATSTRVEKEQNRSGMASTSQERMQSMREAAKTRMAVVKEKAAKRVAEIKDKAKQDAATKIADQFDNLNSTWTDKFMKQLDQYEALVQKMRARAAIAASSGKDVTAANAAIQSAVTAIATAKNDVTAQAAKTYTVDTATLPTSTATTTGQAKLMQELRKSFQTLHATLFKDLFALRDGPMKDARTAVQTALQSLSQVPKVDEGNTTSTSNR